jgi:hypothetical protein
MYCSLQAYCTTQCFGSSHLQRQASPRSQRREGPPAVKGEIVGYK